MKYYNFSLLSCLYIIASLSNSTHANAQIKTHISGFIQNHENLDSISVYFDLDDNIPDPAKRRIYLPLQKGYFSFECLLNHPAEFVIQKIKRSTSFLVEPGDSIHLGILSDPKDTIVLSGRGYLKNIVLAKGRKMTASISRPKNMAFTSCQSLDDYLEFSRYVDSVQKNRQNLLSEYKGQLSADAYSIVQVNLLTGDPERYRANKFFALLRNARDYKLNDKDLINIYDSTIGKSLVSKIPITDVLAYSSDYLGYSYVYSIIRYCRDQKFESGSEERAFFKGMYETVQNIYTGLLRERILSDHILDVFIKHSEAGNADLEQCLKHYYAQSGYAEYKDHVKELYKQSLTLVKGMEAPGFTLPDKDEKWIDLKDLKGKVVLIDFWFTGCAPCAALVPVLHQIHETFKDNPEFVMMNVSIDKRETWLKSLERKIFTTGKGTSVYTAGNGKQHSMIKNYLASFPKLVLIGKDGHIVSVMPPEQRPTDKGDKRLIGLISQHLKSDSSFPSPILEDGPTVLYGVDDTEMSIVRVSNYKAQLVKRQLIVPPSSREHVKVTFENHPDWNFSIPLKHKLKVEPAEYSASNKLFVLSDIEGEFGAFRMMLLSAGVIDEKYNWTFSNGHLVLLGDFFDRGDNVAETLWLIYKLEEEAERHGGYVHFILGNHEIMNLSGDYRYVRSKYFDAARVKGMTYWDMFGRNSELGRWLRTKNIMERIGDILFVHAGVHPMINALPFSINKINQIARPYYDKAKLLHEESDSTLQILFDGGTSPFWFRGYYSNIAMNHIDSTLEKFQVNRIVTGHTIVSDTISIHYNGKVINVDTKHAEGKSEGLLFKEDKFFRVNQRGIKLIPALSQLPLNRYMSSHRPNR